MIIIGGQQIRMYDVKMTRKIIIHEHNVKTKIYHQALERKAFHNYQLKIGERCITIE